VVGEAGLVISNERANVNSVALYADLFDASALVKIFTDEPKSDVVREYFYSRATKYTTPFCFFEALNILKSKWRYQGQLQRDEYLAAAFKLTAWYGAAAQKIKDTDLTNPLAFQSAQTLVERTGLDLSDAFQIISVKEGYFSRLINDSRTLLVTADKELAAVARAEGVRVWSVMEEAAP
jgi:predicted nucleic acid-binding protein